MKTLSVLMPNFNHGRYVRNALEAILKQSHAPLEIIVADDASTDNSIEIIEALAADNANISLIRNHSRKGAVENVNDMLRVASGDYVFGAAADDVILPGLFEASMALLERFPGAGLCSSLSRKIDEHGRDLGLFSSPIISFRQRFLSPRRAAFNFARGREWIMGNTAIYNRRYLLDEGRFDPTLRSYADGFMQMVLTMKHGACFIPRPLACWRLLDSSFSAATRDDTNLWHAVIARAEQIAELRYPDLFPEALMMGWKAHHLLQIALWERQHLNNSGGNSALPRQTRYEGAARIRAFVRRVFGNAACALRILGIRRTAIKAMQRAVDFGYINSLTRLTAGATRRDA